MELKKPEDAPQVDDDGQRYETHMVPFQAASNALYDQEEEEG
jgi:hypothetical protein